MQPKELLDNLSTHLKNAIARAISIATSLGHAHVNEFHLLAGLREEKGAVASEIIKKAPIPHEYLLDRLAEIKSSKDDRASILIATIPELDAVSKKSLERAMLLAYDREHAYIGTEHLLYGLLQSDSKKIATLCLDLAIEKNDLLDQLEQCLEGTSKFPQIEDVHDALEGLQSFIEQPQLPSLDDDSQNESSSSTKRSKQRPKALELFAVELTNLDRQKNIDPVIGREEEIERLIHILSRRTKNNPVLVGEPGVGKTAIVEGLAKRIVEGDVPAVLKRKRLFSLDLTLLISGTIYRGEFEARLKQLIDECAANENYILFIDEIHNIIGAGSNQGTMDAANILKPALARGQLRCVGATTIDEYKKFITQDAALDRRFQEIPVDEPTQEEAIIILSGIKKYYEAFHETDILPETIEAAVSLANRYIHNTFLPDKAIDLIDEAAASVRVKQKPTAFANKVQQMETQLDTLQEKKEAAILNEEFEQAMKYKTAIATVQKEIATLKKKKEEKQSIRKKVTPKDVATVLSKKLHIKRDILLENEWEQLKSLERRLTAHVVGQPKAIHEVVTQLQQAHIGMGRKNKPLASFLFTGPSGVGKTKLAEALAAELYFDPKALVRIDMSEFAEAHGVSKLLGSPAGYVGYKERNKFLDAIHARPHAVVLFDEFDKAHPDVQKLLYQILDEGTLTDGSGKKISFRQATVIMTSNVGAELFKHGSFGFGDGSTSAQTKQLQTQVTEALKERFGSAFLGRIEQVSLFSPLSQKDTEKIVKKHIAQLSRQLLESRNISLEADKTALQALATSSHDKEYGIRHMEHTVDGILQGLLIQVLKKEKTTNKRHYTLQMSNGSYHFE